MFSSTLSFVECVGSLSCSMMNSSQLILQLYSVNSFCPPLNSSCYLVLLLIKCLCAWWTVVPSPLVVGDVTDCRFEFFLHSDFCHQLLLFFVVDLLRTLGVSFFIYWLCAVFVCTASDGFSSDFTSETPLRSWCRFILSNSKQSSSESKTKVLNFFSYLSFDLKPKYLQHITHELALLFQNFQRRLKS